MFSLTPIDTVLIFIAVGLVIYFYADAKWFRGMYRKWYKMTHAEPLPEDDPTSLFHGQNVLKQITYVLVLFGIALAPWVFFSPFGVFDAIAITFFGGIGILLSTVIIGPLIGKLPFSWAQKLKRIKPEDVADKIIHVAEDIGDKVQHMVHPDGNQVTDKKQDGKKGEPEKDEKKPEQESELEKRKRASKNISDFYDKA